MYQIPPVTPLSETPDSGVTFLLPLCVNQAQLNKILTAVFAGHYASGRGGTAFGEDASYIYPLLEAMAWINDPEGQGCWSADNALCQAVIDCLQSSNGDLGTFTACLAGKVLEDCLEALSNEILALDGDYLDVFDNPPSWQQMNAQHIADYGVDMPLPTIEFRLENCSLEYRWETQADWQIAGALSAANCPDLVGAQGPQGLQGLQGLPGIDGVDGVDGQDCDCGSIGQFNVTGSTDETPYTADNEICGGMLAWRDYAFAWANFILDQREAELSGAELVIRLVGMFPFLDPVASSLASFLAGLGEYGVALARVQINDPDFQTQYMCGIYNLVYPQGRYTQALHDAIADEYLTTIPDQTQLMDHMLWFIGWSKLNRVFEAGATEPSDTCELLCGNNSENPANLQVLAGTIYSVTDLGTAWEYIFQSELTTVSGLNRHWIWWDTENREPTSATNRGNATGPSNVGSVENTVALYWSTSQSPTWPLQTTFATVEGGRRWSTNANNNTIYWVVNINK